MAEASAWPALAANATVAEVTAALASGADVDAVDRRGRTAILHAAMAGNLPAVRQLIQAGADIDAQDRTSLNPFLWACMNGNAELVRVMLAAGCDLARLTRFGGVGIHPAAEKGHLEVVEILATTAINVNHTNICGWTPLLEAIILGDGGPVQQQIVGLLLAADADPNLVDQWGVSPAGHAQQMGFEPIVALLESAGGR
jgi:ankyrin repeat protein